MSQQSIRGIHRSVRGPLKGIETRDELTRSTAAGRSANSCRRLQSDIRRGRMTLSSYVPLLCRLARATGGTHATAAGRAAAAAVDV